ncbi:hypothetical protein PV766_11470 [Rhodococcus sp. As11]
MTIDRTAPRSATIDRTAPRSATIDRTAFGRPRPVAEHAGRFVGDHLGGTP